MTTYRNAGYQTRRWDDLTDPTTGRTLELAPDETVDLDVDRFADPYLVPVKPKPTKHAPPKEQ